MRKEHAEKTLDISDTERNKNEASEELANLDENLKNV
jgi:hypothetical protein